MLSTLRIENSPFNEQQLKQLQSSIGGLNPDQSQWLSGYLAGRLADSRQPADTSPTVQEPADTLSIIYATETGNSRSIATELAANMKSQGISVELHAMEDFRPAALRKLKNIAFVISTHGEGAPPEEALDLFEYLESERAPRLDGLNYRILALGDRSYQFFCEAGRRLDKRLQVLGATSFGSRVECDVDFAANASVYSDEVIRFAHENLATQKAGTQTDPLSASHLSLVPTESHCSREQPFSAEVGMVQKITGLDSAKDVYHLELSLEDSGLQYQPGDALGVWAPNAQQVVEYILEKLQINASEPVRVNERELGIGEALIHHLEITRLTTDTVLGFATVSGRSKLETLFSGFEPGQQREFIEQRQLADLAGEYPCAVAPQALVDLLRPLSPRSYSIASSQNMVDGEVHLTVATLHSDAIGVPRQGAASGYLNHRITPGGQVKVFLEPNDRFRLPGNCEAPVIMIAAGTGIAPYRAFMQELESRGANPDSWLIFGNPHLRTDFLYQREWLRWRDSGLLNRIDTAWSRDQAKKHYVQDVVRQQAARIDRWLQRGAHLYLCGSLHMGQAVQQALQEVLAQQRGIEPGVAATLLAELRRERRIKKDLY
jgi:sulfite reductase (NADPH) flavoprotein alpha-component